MKKWNNTCKVSESNVVLTFESKADTTVPVYYTKESYINGVPDEIISLKANERKTTIIDKPEIYRFGITQYDLNTLKLKSTNTNITFAGVKGTILDGHRLFDSATGLVDTDLTYLDTSKMTSMYGMFNLRKQSQLKKIDTSNWDTSNVTTMCIMFQGCSSLTYIDTSNWDISKVTDMSYMFFRCYNLCLTDFEGFLNKDFSNVSNTEGMFAWCTNIIKNPTDANYTTSINKINLFNLSVIGLEIFIDVYVYKWIPIKIGKNIKQISLIGDNDTYGDWMPCMGIDHFEVENNDLVYTSDDKKLLISKDGKMLYDIAHNIEGTLVIPEGIEKIRTGCARSLSSVNMNNIKQQLIDDYDKLPDNFYLKSYKGVDTIDLPSTLTFIGYRVMQYTDENSKNPILKTIICRAIEPPIVKNNTFLSYRGRNNLTLKVPSESIDKYKAANQWKDFKDIQAIQ